MTLLNHLATGAAVAVAVRNPYIAIPLALILHLVCDIIPHFGVPGDSDDVFERNKRLSFRLTLILSILLTIPFLIFAYKISDNISPWLLSACLVASVFPDLIWVPRFFREVITHEAKPRGPISEIHVRIQHDSLVVGAIDEIVWLALMLLIIIKLR